MGLQVSAAFMGANSFHNQIETDRKILESRIRQWGLIPRVVMPGDFAVTPGPAHNVNVAAGMAFLPPKGLAVGSYFVYSDGVDVVSLHAATTNPFIDTVILRVADDQYGTVTGTKGARYDVIQGTPNASPVAPSDATIDALNVPGTWMRLCDVRVNTADTGVIPGGQFTTPPSLGKLAVAPQCKITQTAAQTLTNNVVNQINFDVEEIDTDAMGDLANNRIVIQTPGVYLLQAMATFTGNATGSRTCYLEVNGSVKFADYRATLGASFSTISCCGGLLRLAQGDLVTFHQFQNSGGGLTVGAVNGGPFVSACWVGP